MSIENQSDEALMTRFRETLDGEVFRVLVSRHIESGFRVATGLLGGSSAADDAVQEALIRIVRSRRKYKPGKPFAPWFYTILRNVCADIRRRRVRRAVLYEAFAADLPSRTLDDGAFVRAREIRAGLPPEDARLIDLRFAHGYSSAEIAEQLGCSTEAVKKRFQRLFSQLRR